MTTHAATATPWNLDKGRPAGEMGYLPGLDAIRALAVLGVMFYHADLPWMPGGFLGVDVFFVLSGFLITSLLLEEFNRGGRINFKRFYIRRARRLLPALLLMLAVVGALAAFVYRDAAPAFRADAIASLFYVNNWWYIAADQSYFEFIGRPPLLKHLWSLAIEEQFYLIWPLITLALLKFGKRRAVLYTALIGAVASTVWMAVLSISNGFPELADPSRAYFGTDTHIMGLLLGAALATVWRPGRLSTRLTPGAQALIMGLGFASLAAIIWVFWQVGEFSSFLYRGGFLAFAALVCLLVATASHPGTPFGRLLGTQPWRYIGQRSYGLYLWHWPVFMVTRPDLDIGLDGIPNLILRFGLTFGLAELSYRYVEMPIRRGAIKKFFTDWRNSDDEDKAHLAQRVLVGTGVSFAAVALVGAGLATAPTANEQLAPDVAAAIGIANGGPTSILIDASPRPTPAPAPTPTPTATGESAPTSAPKPSGPASNANGILTAIGDSVMLGVAPHLQDKIKKSSVDAEVSRQASGVLERVEALAAADLLAPTVVIHTGTNGIITEDQLRTMLDTLSDRERVVVINVNVPRRWTAPNNEMIAVVVPDYPNAVIADWASVSAGRSDFFVSDGVHPTWEGTKAFVREIMAAAGL
ncbi:MAG: acyltransferase [Candidatus Nanopelagicales bacterium]|nr:acyltransferase [Candidatus Nanopelagicales bacterium]MDP4888001.1 acyltransferase [Candidatus Nanopelagicales bacterium]